MSNTCSTAESCHTLMFVSGLQGVRTSHQDFAGRIGDGASTFGGSVWDDNGHGETPRSLQLRHDTAIQHDCHCIAAADNRRLL
jgi:hypothetical protein